MASIEAIFTVDMLNGGKRPSIMSRATPEKLRSFAEQVGVQENDLITLLECSDSELFGRVVAMNIGARYHHSLNAIMVVSAVREMRDALV